MRIKLGLQTVKIGSDDQICAPDSILKVYNFHMYSNPTAAYIFLWADVG